MDIWDDEIDEGRIFHEGIGLFNRGRWFEAHEVWEDIWYLASGERKTFYQGLIMCAYVMVHVQRGSPRGVKTSYASLAYKFKDLPGEFMGVEISLLQGEMLGYIKPILGMGRGCFVASLGSGQLLPVDLADAPRIRLAYDPFNERFKI